jgi:thioredoxin 1
MQLVQGSMRRPCDILSVACGVETVPERKRRMKKMLGSICLAAMLIVVAAAGSGCAGQDRGDGKKGNPSAAGKKVTFIELGSDRCIPCRMMQPVLKTIRERYGAEVDVVFHDVWTEQGRPYAERFNVRVIPTQVFLDAEGKEFHRHEGYYPENEIIGILKSKGVGK